MIPEYRIDDDKVETRRLALMCLIHHNIDINKSAYEFCDYVVTEGLLDNIEAVSYTHLTLPTKA